MVSHAEPLPTTTVAEQMLRSDLLRSAWMFAVGALDAYFCDAYTDIVAATIISKSRHRAMALPDFFYDIRFPVRAILEPYAVNVNWKWRMGARKMMEREYVLSLEEIQKLFNKFFRKGHRLYGDLLDSWIAHPQSRGRLFGIAGISYAALSPADKNAARKGAKDQMDGRFASIFQRRHDCIHNCDRPKVAPQRLSKGGNVLRVIEDVEFLVNRCNEHINAEFRQFLLDAGCPAAIVTQAGY
jgi:hypothetical protein